MTTRIPERELPHKLLVRLSREQREALRRPPLARHYQSDAQLIRAVMVDAGLIPALEDTNDEG